MRESEGGLRSKRAMDAGFAHMTERAQKGNHSDGVEHLPKGICGR